MASPSTSTPTSLSAGSCSSSIVPPQPRAQPAGEQVCLRLRPGHLDAADAPDPRPERGEVRPPAARCGPTRCRRRRRDRRSRTGRPYGSGRPGHSVLSTINRSTVSTSCSNCRSPNGGTPRQRRKTGRSGSSSGSTTLAGACVRLPPSRSLIVSLQTRFRPTGEAVDPDARVEPVVRLGLREEHDRPRRMPLRQPGEHVLGRLDPGLGHPGDVGHHARPLQRLVRLGIHPQRGELVLDVGDRR